MMSNVLVLSFSHPLAHFIHKLKEKVGNTKPA